MFENLVTSLDRVCAKLVIMVNVLTILTVPCVVPALQPTLLLFHLLVHCQALRS